LTRVPATVRADIEILRAGIRLVGTLVACRALGSAPAGGP
jgi:hypothetical protein